MSDKPEEAVQSPSAVKGVALTTSLVLLYDTLAAAGAMFASLVIRYHFSQYNEPPGALEYLATAVFAPISAAVFLGLGVHRGLWRHMSMPDLLPIVQAVLLSHLIFLPVFFVMNRLEDFPRSTFALSAPLLVFLLVAPRVAAAAWRSGDLRSLVQRGDESAPMAVLVGAREHLADVLKAHLRRASGPSFRFRALVETEGQAGGRALYGIPIEGGPDKLTRAVLRVKRLAGDGAVRIVLADPMPDATLVNEVARVAGRTGVQLSRARGGNGARAFTSVEASDLLARPPRALSRDGARRLIAGKRVLVTGAGGTIGSELVRQAAALGPERLILLDSAEPNLYEIDMVLQTMKDAPSWRSVLGDIKDRKGLDVLMAEERPEVVLHAAALKHVPLMEGNVSETVRTNLMGTRNVVESAAEAEVEAVVSISTDKAVDPSSIMGASKRAVELYLAAAADKVEPMKLASVRFGNVLGSAGSVVPLFERQIAEGGPVTVTDSDTTRYFMTVEEAAGLVLEAGAQAGAVGLSGGDIFLLDMGEPVLISRLARQLIRLRGLEPERDVKIVFTGLRPGEKLHEALTHAFESVSPAGPPGVMRIETPNLDLTRVDSALEQLIAAAQRRDDDQVRNRLNLVIEAGWPEGVAAISQTLPAARDA